MEVVITIALLIVPVISIVAIFMSIKNATTIKAMKQLIIDLSRVNANSSPTEEAMRKFKINEL